MALPEFTMRQLLESGAHFGHRTQRWNPKMAPYIYGSRNSIHIIDLTQTVSLLNQERSNNRLYVALVDSSPTAYYDDKTMPSVPGSVLNVMQAGLASNRALITTPETAVEQTSLAFDSMVTGSYSLRIHVK